MNKIANIVDNIIGQSVNTRSIVFCVGAGASLYAGAPTQDEIISELGKLAQINKNDMFGTDTESFYEYTSNLLGRSRVFSQISKLSENLMPTELHRALAKSPANIFITTNYDTLLEKAMRLEDVEFEVVTYGSHSYSMEKQKTIVKLSGTVDKPDTLVLTRFDQKMIRKKRTELQSLARAYLSNNLVLFIGCDLKTGLRDFYEKFGLESNILNNWIVLANEINPLDQSLWNRRGVKLIKIENELLALVVNELSMRISQRKKKISTSKRKRKIFISGGIKNIKLVNRIKSFLQEIGLSPVEFSDIPSEGRTLSEKFSAMVQESDVAIVIFEEDDRFTPNVRGANANLFFELGYLVSSLGQENVMVIQSTQQSLPITFVGSEILVYDPQKSNLLLRQLENWLGQL